jgi:predicted ribosomally synthesized peptide with SipW-like signal peptide
MADAFDTSFEQLGLFEPSGHDAPAVPARARRRRRPGGPLRISLTILAIGVATAGIIAGSFASWNAQSTNPGNAVAAGTLTLGNNKSAASVFSATNVKPGDTGSSTVVISNTGSIPMSVSLTQDTLTSTGIEASLGLKVHDDTRNWCYWPLPAASGACGASYGAWNASGTFSAFPIPATSGAAQWPAAQAHTFTISWQLATSSPNSDQGKTGSFRLVWDGVQ